MAWHTFTKVDHHRAVIFGGFTGSTELNDTYVLDMETWVWRYMFLKIDTVLVADFFSISDCKSLESEESHIFCAQYTTCLQNEKSLEKMLL